MAINRATVIKLVSYVGVAFVAGATHRSGLAESAGIVGTGLVLLGATAHAWAGHLGLDFVHDLSHRFGGEDKARGITNRNLHQLIGRTIARILEDASKHLPGGDFGSAWLMDAAAAFRGERWLNAQLVGPGRALSEQTLQTYLPSGAEAIENAPVLEKAEWVALVSNVVAPTLTVQSEQALDDAAMQLQDRFATELRESIKEAWEKGDLAWPALILRVLTEVLSSADNEATDLTELRKEVAILRDVVVQQAKPAMNSPRPSDDAMVEAIRGYQNELASQLIRMEGKIDTVIVKIADLKNAFSQHAATGVNLQHQNSTLGVLLRVLNPLPQPATFRLSLSALCRSKDGLVEAKMKPRSISLSPYERIEASGQGPWHPLALVTKQDFSEFKIESQDERTPSIFIREPGVWRLEIEVYAETLGMSLFEFWLSWRCGLPPEGADRPLESWIET